MSTLTELALTALPFALVVAALVLLVRQSQRVAARGRLRAVLVTIAATVVGLLLVLALLRLTVEAVGG